MSPGELLYQALESDPTTFGLLGGRVQPNRLDAGTTYPAATYQLLTNKPAARTRATVSCAPYDEGRVQLNLYGTTYAQTSQLAEAVRLALRNSPFEFEDEGDQYDDRGEIGGRWQYYRLLQAAPSASNP